MSLQPLHFSLSITTNATGMVWLRVAWSRCEARYTLHSVGQRQSAERCVGASIHTSPRSTGWRRRWDEQQPRQIYRDHGHAPRRCVGLRQSAKWPASCTLRTCHAQVSARAAATPARVAEAARPRADSAYKRKAQGRQSHARGRSTSYKRTGSASYARTAIRGGVRTY